MPMRLMLLTFMAMGFHMPFGAAAEMPQIADLSADNVSLLVSIIKTHDGAISDATKMGFCGQEISEKSRHAIKDSFQPRKSSSILSAISVMNISFQNMVQFNCTYEVDKARYIATGSVWEDPYERSLIISVSKLDSVDVDGKRIAP
jgi:hypothetical protein